jgi:hypothetical protein
MGSHRHSVGQSEHPLLLSIMIYFFIRRLTERAEKLRLLSRGIINMHVPDRNKSDFAVNKRRSKNLEKRAKKSGIFIEYMHAPSLFNIYFV